MLNLVGCDHLSVFSTIKVIGFLNLNLPNLNFAPKISLFSEFTPNFKIDLLRGLPRAPPV